MIKKNIFTAAALLCAGVLFCAFQWPWDNQPDSAPPGAGAKAHSTQPSLGQPAKMKAQPPETKAAPEAPKSLKIKSSAKPTAGTKKPAASAASAVKKAGPGTMPPAPKTTPAFAPKKFSAGATIPKKKVEAPLKKTNSLPARPALPRAPLQAESLQIQKKINDVVRLNETLNKLNRVRIAQVQTLVDQAREHQSLLNELSNPADSAGDLKTSAADQVLKNAKLRMIRREAEKNLAMAENGRQNEKTPHPG